jgi:hypothetical protein
MQAGPFADLVRSYTAPALNDLMVQATRACETETGRRLAPFTGVTESHRCSGMDPDEYADSANLPLDLAGTLGRSYAYALGASSLVRHMWLHEYAPHYPEFWSYTVASLTIIRSYGGSESLTVTQYVGPELDSGHIWFNLGKFIPVGSLARAVYGGGYQTIPADLVRACIWMAASIAATELDPMLESHGHNPGSLEEKAVGWLSAYQRMMT